MEEEIRGKRGKRDGGSGRNCRCRTFESYRLRNSRVTAYAFNVGPGHEGHDVHNIIRSSRKQPAYNNGWTSNVGPGASGSNPGGGLDSEKDYVYSKGPGNEAAQQYAKTENSTIYIHNTYRGGSWRQRADGKWALYKPDGNPVSSQWGYVDGKTYLLDMYGSCRPAGRMSMETVTI